MIEARDLRVDARGGPCIDGLAFAADAPRTVVLGAPREIAVALAGLLPVLRGTLRVEGEEPRLALAGGKASVTLFDAPLPPTWSPCEYVEWSARLAGLSRTEARTLAPTLLAKLGVEGKAATKRLGPQGLLVRRATQLAAALVPETACLVLTDPFVDLEPDALALFEARALEVLAARRFVVFVGRLPFGSALARLSPHVVVLAGNAVVAEGPLHEVAARERTWVVRAHGDLARFEAALNARGGVVRPSFGEAALAIELGSMENADILRAAAEAEAIVTEMRPLAAAFA